MILFNGANPFFQRVCIFIRNTIYELLIEVLSPVLLAPIKRPLSRGNTSPAQKMMFFILQGKIQFRRKPFL